MSDDLATADEGAVRWQLQAGVDRNAFYLIAGGVVLLACFALLRAFGNPEGSPGRSVNFATAVALFLTVPFNVETVSSRQAMEAYMSRSDFLWTRLFDTLIWSSLEVRHLGPVRPMVLPRHLGVTNSALAVWRRLSKLVCVDVSVWARFCFSLSYLLNGSGLVCPIRRVLYKNCSHVLFQRLNERGFVRAHGLRTS